MYKWNLQLDGANISVGAFIERLEDLCTARAVSHEEVVRSAFDLFVDPALVWYRTVKSCITTWSQFKDILREEFQPADFNDKLMREIMNRTQGQDEPVGRYIDAMNTLFGRLTVVVSEPVMLKILRKNLAPFYQQQLGLTTIDSVSQFRKVCKQLEDVLIQWNLSNLFGRLWI